MWRRDSVLDPNTATIISGFLSLSGGALGAFGAYRGATNQMKKQIVHEKEKVEALKMVKIKKTLKKLQLLNGYAMLFVNSFENDFNKPYNEEFNFKLKSSETSLSWIANSI